MLRFCAACTTSGSAAVDDRPIPNRLKWSLRLRCLR
jgi:hypothetical protein